jgi:hypothetical protein
MLFVWYFYDYAARVSALASILGQKTIELEINNVGSTHEGFRRSSRITKLVMDTIRKRASNIEIFTFCVDGEQPYYDEFKKISSLENFQFIDGIPQAIKAYEAKGFVARTPDRTHWNEMGHKIAAKKLIENIKNYCYIVD